MGGFSLRLLSEPRRNLQWGQGQRHRRSSPYS
jgi:hypothetical protein